MESVLLIICALVFLFTVYILSRDDFILLRKNVSMDQVFDLSFLALFFGLFVSRLFFVATHFNPQYFNPLIFLALPYYPGLSIVGGVSGFVGFVLYYTLYKKIPKERIFDFFATGLLLALTLGYLVKLGLIFAQKQTPELFMYATPVLLLVLSIIYCILLIPRQRRGEMKDAHLGLIFLVAFFASALVNDATAKNTKLLVIFSFEGLVSLVVFVLALALLLKREKRVIKFAKIRI